MAGICVLLVWIFGTIVQSKQHDVVKLYRFLEQQQTAIEKLQRSFEKQQATIEKQSKQIENQQNGFVRQQKELVRLQSKLHDVLAEITDHKYRVDKTQEKRILLDGDGHLPGQHKEGAVYIRWGRSTCPSNGTETVYSGYSGGSYFDHPGAAAEYVCLPQDPVFGARVNISYFGYMYGGEYRTNFFGPLEPQDVPCSVCRSTTGLSSIMVPARSQCYKGWKLEYKGRLATNHYEFKAASQYVCVDERPETLYGGNRNNEGKLFYPVKTVCGSLKCPPYENDRELLCVVCTR